MRCPRPRKGSSSGPWVRRITHKLKRVKPPGPTASLALLLERAWKWQRLAQEAIGDGKPEGPLGSFGRLWH